MKLQVTFSLSRGLQYIPDTICIGDGFYNFLKLGVKENDNPKRTGTWFVAFVTETHSKNPRNSFIQLSLSFFSFYEVSNSRSFQFIKTLVARKAQLPLLVAEGSYSIIILWKC